MHPINDPYITVIIPVFNGERTVIRAIDSALHQELKNDPSPFEVIVVNDGSTDSTSRILAAYARRIRVVEQPNQGLSAARNAGIFHAKGEFLAFLDADDEWLPGKLQLQISVMERHPEISVLAGGANWMSEDGQLEWIARPRKSRRVCLPELFFTNPLNVSSVILRKRCVLEFKEPFQRHLRRCEDWDLWIRLAARVKIMIDTDLVVNHYLTKDGMSRKDPHFLLGAYEETYRQILDGLRADHIVAPLLRKYGLRMEFNFACSLARSRAALYPLEGRKSLLALGLRHPLWMPWKSVIPAILLRPGTEQQIRGILSRIF
jgi:glycosyltransferase involved in cell wall biosynthesis